MNQVETFDLSQAFNEFASESAMAEANAFRTIPTNSYTLQVTKVDGQRFPNDDRPIAHFTADVLDNGRKIATVFFNASWVERRDGQGKLDGNFNRYAQLARTLYPDMTASDRAKVPVAEVIERAKLYPLRARITESFHVVNGTGVAKWVTPKSEEEIKQYRMAGLPARNFVQSLSRV